MRKIYLLLPLALILMYVTFSSSSGGLSSDLTRATSSSSSSCGSCHGSSSSSISVSVMLDSSGVSVTRYVPGNTYKVIITGVNSSSSSLPAHGFQLAVVKSSGAGSSSASDGGTLATSGLPSGTHNVSTSGIHIFEHTTRISPVSGSGGSGTVYSDTISWTAPSSGTGSVVIYGVLNAVDVSRSSSGDRWRFASPVTITELTTSGGGIGAITGASSVCVGDTVRFSDTTAGGTWASSDPTIATISSTGLATGVSSGTVTISYYTATDTATTSFLVNPATAVGTISGPATVCVTGTGTFINTTVGGGVWSTSAPTIATISTSGRLTGVSRGTVTVSYMVTSSTCPPAYATRSVTIAGPPTVSAISGRSALCAGDTTTYTDSTSGGRWSVSSPTIGTINATTGLYTAVSSGIDTVKYTVTTACGSTVATYLVTVNSIPSPGVISGTSTFCLGGSDTFTTTGVTGGRWRSDSSFVVAIDSVTGIARAVGSGTTTIRYVVTSALCGSASATFASAVISSSSAGSIIGPSVICSGVPTSYAPTVPGGTWSISSTSVATFNTSTLQLTGLSTGTVTLSYIVTSTCGTDTVTSNITINTAPNSGTITSASRGCVGSAVTFTTSGSAGGLWFSSNPSVASVIGTLGSGRVNGTGTTTISYITSSASCGSDTAFLTFTGETTPILPAISGPSVLCTGLNDTFSIATTGGVWRSSVPTIATIDSVTGVVRGLSTGSTTISYVVTNSCGPTSTTVTLNISPLPAGGTISGPNPLCLGTSDTFRVSGASPGGSWSSSSSTIASVIGSSSGVSRGSSVGSVTISYTVATAGCPSTSSTYSTTVSGPPSPGSITGPTTVCSGATISLTPTVGGGAWSSRNTSVATVNASGVVTGNSVGSATIVYKVTGTCGTDSTTYPVSVTTVPATTTLTGTDSVCENAGTISLTPGVGGGTWSSATPSIATVNSTTGLITGLARGTATIIYTVFNSCGGTPTSKNIRVIPVADPGIITGLNTVCTGSTISLTPSIAGGVWSSSDASVASVSTSGVVFGRSNGSATISYGVSNTCGVQYVTHNVSVITSPTAGLVSGGSSTCIGTPLSFIFSGTGGGVWSVSNPGIASIDATGGLTATGTGTTRVIYTLVTSCATISDSVNVTINPTPDAGVITGRANYCTGNTATLVTTGTGGNWSTSSSTIASIDGSGNVTAVAAGTAIITYLVNGGICGISMDTFLVAVANTPFAGVVTGADTICEGITTTFTTTGSAGIWSTSSASIASVDGSGNVTGTGGGTVTISYTAANACSTNVATATLVVNPLPVLPSVSGPSSLCPGGSVTLTASPSGGSWSSSNPSIASVNTSGNITGLSSGSSTISYTLTNGCGSTTQTYVEIVNPLPDAGSISGPVTLCTGTTGTMTSTTAGGSWSTSAPGIVSVSTTGTVYSVSVGTATITYIYSNSCGSDTSTYSVSGTLTPSVGTITGAPSVCEAASVIYSNPTSGGVWSSSNTGIASVSTTGTVYGVSGGTADISYTVTTTCGTATATQTITVNPLPVAGAITGADSVCLSSTTLLTATGTGTWSTSAASIASIALSGMVTGVATGSATISYTVTNGCGSNTSTITMRVLPTPSAGTITGASTVCTGTSISLSSSVSGGTWSSSSPSVASVFGTGSVLGVSTGAVTITYTYTNSCGTAFTTQNVTVSTVPTVSATTGATTVCAGANITLTNTTGGGTWSSSSSSVATVNTSGVVYGVATGTATISYTVSNFCGSVSATHAVTVNTIPSPGTISGTLSTCPGISVRLSSTSSGGSWSSAAPSIATVDGSGNVYGVSAGTTTISYTVSAACGTSSTMASFTVNPLPFAGTLTGPSALCVGSTATYSSSVSGGTWSSTDASIVSVSSAGVARANTAGTANVVYSVTNVCGTATSSAAVAATAPATTGSISGPTRVCLGSTISLSASLSGGTWSATSGVAISAFGVVTGLRAGTATVSYSFTNVCGTNSATYAVSVDTPLSTVGSISGPRTLCVGDTTHYTFAGSGGRWASRTGNVYMTSTGEATAVTAGLDTIVYTVNNACGIYTAKLPVRVNSKEVCAAGIDQQVGTQATMVIAPNPSDGAFYIRLSPHAEPVHVVILDVKGAVVANVTGENTATTIPVNLDNVAAGNYIVKVIVDGKAYRQLITVEK